jgi:hypothetical protein
MSYFGYHPGYEAFGARGGIGQEAEAPSEPKLRTQPSAASQNLPEANWDTRLDPEAVPPLPADWKAALRAMKIRLSTPLAGYGSALGEYVRLGMSQGLFDEIDLTWLMSAIESLGIYLAEPRQEPTFFQAEALKLPVPLSTIEFRGKQIASMGIAPLSEPAFREALGQAWALAGLYRQMAQAKLYNRARVTEGWIWRKTTEYLRLQPDVAAQIQRDERTLDSSLLALITRTQELQLQWNRLHPDAAIPTPEPGTPEPSDTDPASLGGAGIGLVILAMGAAAFAAWWFWGRKGRGRRVPAAPAAPKVPSMTRTAAPPSRGGRPRVPAEVFRPTPLSAGR